jgi:hypothetical protein
VPISTIGTIDRFFFAGGGAAACCALCATSLVPTPSCGGCTGGSGIAGWLSIVAPNACGPTTGWVAPTRTTTGPLRSLAGVMFIGSGVARPTPGPSVCRWPRSPPARGRSARVA